MWLILQVNKSILKDLSSETFNGKPLTKEEAFHFKLKHEDKVDIWSENEGSQWFVKFKKGALIMVPKAIPFYRLVAGQLPTGWDAKRYGDQVDPCTLWSLVATAEAFASAGITEPYELYKYVQFQNCYSRC